jgi:hypothetical protein
LLPVAAQVAFLAYLGIHTGDPLAPFHAQQHGWHRSISILPLVFAQTLWHSVLLAPRFEAAVEVAFTLLWCGLFLHAWRMRLPGEYLIYAALAILIPTSAGSLLSIGRFGLVAFPLYWALAHLGQSPRIDTLVKVSFPILLATFILLTYTTTSLTP